MNEPQQAYQWHSPMLSSASHDVPQLLARLQAQLARWGLQAQDLGPDDSNRVWLYRKIMPDPALPAVLVAAGFHGEEPAGPWGLLHFLEQQDPVLQRQVNLSLLPAVNLAGLGLGTRFNQHGENPNRGYQERYGHTPSREGVVLLQHGDVLQQLARNGILTCHEDVLLSQAYLYSFEREPQHAALSAQLRQALGRHLPLIVDGIVDDCQVNNGVIKNHADSSFESWLFDAGAELAYCTETPGQAEFDVRIRAVAEVIQVFLQQVAGARGLG